jgi:archaeal type IV pilus assembly protein PilA
MKSFRRNLKAISPIFATLILIAIAVIAGVVVYAFVAGFLGSSTGGTNAATERVTVSGATGTESSVKVYLQNMDPSNAVTVTGILVKDSTGTIATAMGNDLSGTTDGITQAQGLVEVDGAVDLTLGATYTATVTTLNGGQFVSQSFIVVADAVAP